jgi:bleomycin hydrolase
MNNPHVSWEVNRRNLDAPVDFVFEHEVSIQPECANQGSSGRCWLFAGLNAIRVPFIKAFDLPLDFEFSQNFLFFWDKYERSRYFLQTYRNVKAGNVASVYASDGRLTDFLLKRPIVDGGQWNMLTNLVAKYGLVPKSCYDDVYASKDSSRMNMVLNSRLKEAIAFNQGTSEVMRDVFEILKDFLGPPPQFVQWRYKTAKGKVIVAPKVTPVEFFETFVRPVHGCDLSEYVSIVDDPRNEYGRTYTVDYLNNMIDGDEVLYLNMGVSDMSNVARESILQDLPVWFGSDVMPFTSREHCLSGLTYFRSPPSTMTKKQRLETLDSCLTHAMVLHGFDAARSKWKVENSWGQKGPFKGYYVMDQPWFENYAYQVSVHKSVAGKLPMKTQPVRHPPWDAFGSLARRRLAVPRAKCFRGVL